MTADERLEALAEAIVFAHDADAVPAAAADPDTATLAHTAALAMAALVRATDVPASLQARLATAALHFCAEHPDRAARGVATVRARWRRSTLFACAVGIAAFWIVWLLVRTDPAAQRPVGELRTALLAADAADVRWNWQAGPSPLRGEVTGDVVWSSARQEGYLSFRGLPPLDAQHRFQLWIVDGRREGAPVDGGVFGVADAATETVVPVRAALPIGQPAAFVVTVEDHRGVVVSRQEHVVALARP